MKKKVFAILMSLCLVVSLTPGLAFAELACETDEYPVDCGIDTYYTYEPYLNSICCNSEDFGTLYTADALLPINCCIHYIAPVHKAKLTYNPCASEFNAVCGKVTYNAAYCGVCPGDYLYKMNKFYLVGIKAFVCPTEFSYGDCVEKSDILVKAYYKKLNVEDSEKDAAVEEGMDELNEMSSEQLINCESTCNKDWFVVYLPECTYSLIYKTEAGSSKRDCGIEIDQNFINNLGSFDGEINFNGAFVKYNGFEACVPFNVNKDSVKEKCDESEPTELVDMNDKYPTAFEGDASRFNTVKIYAEDVYQKDCGKTISDYTDLDDEFFRGYNKDWAKFAGEPMYKVTYYPYNDFSEGGVDYRKCGTVITDDYETGVLDDEFIVNHAGKYHVDVKVPYTYYFYHHGFNWGPISFEKEYTFNLLITQDELSVAAPEKYVYDDCDYTLEGFGYDSLENPVDILYTLKPDKCVGECNPELFDVKWTADVTTPVDHNDYLCNKDGSTFSCFSSIPNYYNGEDGILKFGYVKFVKPGICGDQVIGYGKINSGIIDFTNVDYCEYPGEDIIPGTDLSEYTTDSYNIFKGWYYNRAFTKKVNDVTMAPICKTHVFYLKERRGCCPCPETYVITATAGANGSIEPEGEVKVIEGADKTFVFTPDFGYEVDDVLIDEESIGPVDTYTFEDVDANHTIHVTFKEIGTEPDEYTITASAGAGGSISPSGEVPVKEHDNQSFTITPDEGYVIDELVIDGNSVEAVDSYTFEDVTEDHEITVTFKSIEYVITATAGDNGSIDPSGEVTVGYGEDQSFTMNPAFGYEVADVVVDGYSVGAVESYDFTDVYENHTIHVTFKEIGSEPKTYTIVSYAGANGTIDPLGDVIVREGDSQSFIITPNSGYEVSSVKVDGVSVGAKSTYTFENVTADHTISVIFTTKPRSTGGATLNTKDHMHYIVGDDLGNFNPEKGLTRAEAATIFYRLLNNQNVSRKYFSDVLSGSWFKDAIEKLAGINVMNGYPNGTFAPDRAITRAEFCAIAARFFKISEGSISFTDVPKTHWAYTYIASAVNKGWIEDKNGAFKPDEFIPRQEVVSIVNHMLNRVPDKNFINSNPTKVISFPDVPTTHPAYYEVMEASNTHDYRISNGNEVWTKVKEYKVWVRSDK